MKSENGTIVAINECDFGSTGNIAIDILKKCSENNYSTYLVTFETKQRYYSEYLINSNKAGNLINSFLCRIDGSDGFHNLNTTKKFIKWLDSIKVSLIHLHNIHGHFINLPMILKYANKKKIPVLWTLHDCWSFTGKCPHFEASKCFKWKKSCGNCPNQKKYPAAYIFDRSSYLLQKKVNLFQKYGDNVFAVCPSHWLDNYFAESKIGFLNHCVIHNGVDRPIEIQKKELDSVSFLLGTNKKIVLFVSDGYRPTKGLNYVVDLSNDKELFDYIFLVIGIDSTILNAGPNLKNIGFVSKEKIAIYYSISDALINPTMEDNFPTVNIEALSYGTPIISFNTGGSPEIYDEKTGVTVEKGSYEGLKHALLSLKNRKFKKDDCYKRYLHFTKNNMCEKYFELIEKLIERSVK